MTQFGYVPRSNSKFFPPTRPIVKAHIPTEAEARALKRKRRQKEFNENTIARREQVRARRIRRGETPPERRNFKRLQVDDGETS